MVDLEKTLCGLWQGIEMPSYSKEQSDTVGLSLLPKEPKSQASAAQKGQPAAAPSSHPIHEPRSIRKPAEADA